MAAALMTSHLAQINIGPLLAPLGSPQIRGFIDQLDAINALAEQSPGFVWRLKTAEGNATALHPYDDDMIIVNYSIWQSAETLRTYVYNSDHVQVLRRRKEWFEKFDSAFIGTGLEAYLRERHLTDVVIGGLTTDHCVSTTTRMAGNLGFTVTVLADGTATFERAGFDGRRYTAEEIHRVSLVSLHSEFASVQTVDDVCHAD